MNFVDWLGFKRKPCWEKFKRLAAFFGFVLKIFGVIIGVIICAIIGASTLFIFLGSLFGMVYATIGFIYGDQTGDYRYISMFLAFTIGAPFLAWRSYTAHKQNEIAINGQIVESISRAVESLGSVRTGVAEDSKQEINLEVRVGALYALQRISDENENFHIQIMKIICAYIRSNASRVENNQGKGEPGARPREDIQIALAVIRDRSTDFAKSEIDKGYRLNLTDADLSGANLSGANLSEADLTKAILRGAVLTNANLFGANLTNANLSRADLTDANLSEANLTKANLIGTNLIGANLTDAKLSRAYLSSPYLSGAQRRGEDLSGAYLSGADLSGAKLIGAILHGADLSRADLHGADLSGAYLSGAILSPDALIGAKLGSEVISEERANALHSDWGRIFPDDLDDDLE